MIREIEGVRLVPVDNDIAVQLTCLPGGFHTEPADRMIVTIGAAPRRANGRGRYQDHRLHARSYNLIARRCDVGSVWLQWMWQLQSRRRYFYG